MPTPKQLDKYSTILGVVLVIMAIAMFWLAAFDAIPQNLIEQWWWPVGTWLVGIAMIFSRENFFRAVDSFFKRKSGSL